MNNNIKSFSEIFKISGVAATLGVLMMIGGCGDGDGGTIPDTTTTKHNTIPAGAVTATAGSLTTTQTVTAQPEGSAVNVISIPSGVTITPPAGTTYSTATTIDVTTFNTVSALPAPLTTGFVVGSTAGAVDVKIGGVNGATFSSPVTITIPLTGTATNCDVYVNKGTGNGYVNLGPAINNATCNADRFATIAVTDLCVFAVDVTFTNGTIVTTGTTGTSGGSTGF